MSTTQSSKKQPHDIVCRSHAVFYIIARLDQGISHTLMLRAARHGTCLIQFIQPAVQNTLGSGGQNATASSPRATHRLTFCRPVRRDEDVSAFTYLRHTIPRRRRRLFRRRRLRVVYLMGRGGLCDCCDCARLKWTND